MTKKSIQSTQYTLTATKKKFAPDANKTIGPCQCKLGLEKVDGLGKQKHY